MGLEVGIVGAGIAGLSAAIALRRLGANIEIFEQSELKNENGAAITITPNGTRILDSWGFDHAGARMTEAQQIKQIDGRTLKTLQLESFKGVPEQFGGGFNFYHRADLHGELRRLATEPMSAGRPALLRVRCRVVDVDCENCILTTSDGSSIQKDLVIIADGVKSCLTSIVVKTASPLKRSSRSAFRAVVPFEEIYQDPDLKKLFDDEPVGYQNFFVPGSLRREKVVTYPCRSGTLLNIAVSHNTYLEDIGKEDWHDTADKRRVLRTLEGYHPLIDRLLSKAPSFNVHNLLLRDPLDELTRGRAVVVGDAAHPMYPTLAQGGVLSVEEAAALGVLLQDATSDQVESRLRLFQETMLDHVFVVQTISNFGDHRKAARRSKARPLFEKGSPQYGDAERDYLYSWDVRQEASRILADAT